MSSMAEKKLKSPAFGDRRSTLFRSDSFDKLQCSAIYSLQLAGSILTQESLIQLLDSFICRSRIMIQKATILFPLPDYKMCCAVILFWIYALTKYMCLNSEKRNIAKSEQSQTPDNTYAVKVQKRKESTAMSAVEAPISETKDIKLATVCESVETASTTVTTIAATSTHPRLTFNNGKLTQFDSESEMGSNASISSRQNVGMVVIVYGSATLVYIQLMILAVFLQSAPTPPGYIFLMANLGIIGFIVYQICFTKTKAKDENRNKNAITSTKTVKSTQSRLIRSTTRRFLYFHNKTLSKIKLL